MIESLGIGTHDLEMQGWGQVAIEGEPSGAEIYCSRYVEFEKALFPFAFRPGTGPENPEPGQVGKPTASKLGWALENA